MSANIIIDPKTNEPIRYDNEFFILKSPKITFEISTETQGKFSGEGYLYITSNRLIITCSKSLNFNIKGFQFPLINIKEEQFKQPFFGKNYLFCKFNLIQGSNFGNSTLTIWFYNPSGTIINILFTLLDSYRSNNNRKLGDDILKGLEENLFLQIFPIDNNDPSTLYDFQPESIPYQNQIAQSEIVLNRNLNNRPRIDQSMIQTNNMIMNNPYVTNVNNKNNKGIIYQSQMQPNYIYKNPGKFEYKNSNFVYQENPLTESRVNLIIDNQELINPYMSNIHQKKVIPTGNYNNNQINNQQGNFNNNNSKYIISNQPQVNYQNKSQQIIYPDQNYLMNNNLNPKGNYPILVNSFLPNNLMSQNHIYNNNIKNNQFNQINISSVGNNENNNNNKVKNNEKLVELMDNPYPKLEEKGNYEQIKTEKNEKNLNVKTEKKFKNERIIPNDYSYSNIDQDAPNSILLNPYDN